MEELQKHLSESFSRTVQEWERIKTQRIKESGSPVPEGATASSSSVGVIKSTEFKRSRKQERSKSRERDRSRSKYERQREKELQKIEKKEQKIEKEKEKLEKMKKKLEDLETMSEAEVRGLSQEFARKLHEWEVMKGLRPEKQFHPEGETSPKAFHPSSVGHLRSNSTKHHSPRISHGRSNSEKQHKDEKIDIKRERTQSEKRERTLSESRMDSLSRQGSPAQGSEGKLEGGYVGRSSSVPSFASKHLVDEATSIDLNLTSDSGLR